MVNHAVMKLKTWIENSGKSNAQIGRELDITGQSVARYASGERMPDPVTVERINKLTAGEVTVTDLHDCFVANMKKNRLKR